MNDLKERWSLIADTFMNDPMILFLSMFGLLFCIGLMLFTFYLASKFKALTYPFLLLTMVAIASLYIDLFIWILGLFK